MNLKVNWKARIGMQDIKIAIAVGICLFASMFINIINVLPAGISAILCMHTSVHKSIREGIKRVCSTIIGAITGVIAVNLYQLKMNNLLFTVYTAAGILLTIYICNLLTMSHMSALAACITFLLVIVTCQGDELYYLAFLRVIATFFGILITVVVNRLIPSKKKEAQGRRCSVS